MGAIARNIANNITTSGVFTSSAITNSSVTGITVLANASDGITLISSQTASNSASLSFTTGIDSTYKAYKFVYVNCHPRTDAVSFRFNGSTDGGSNYNVTKTSAKWGAYHDEADTANGNELSPTGSLDQSTVPQLLNSVGSIGNGSDESISGELIIFNPSSTTYVKHYISRGNFYNDQDFSIDSYTVGYMNTTSAVNAIQFNMASGNFDGTIYLYGIK